MSNEVEYQTTKQGSLQWKHLLVGSTVIFQATAIRRSGGTTPGVHARIKLAELTGKDIHPLYGHTFNIENARDLIWLAGKAHERLNGSKAGYSKDALEQDLILFCDGLWDASVSSSRASEWVMGDAEPSAPRWSVPGMVLEGSTGIHFGDAKSGKSTEARILAQCLQYGIRTLFPALKQGNVVWVNAEEPPSEHSRQFGNVNAAIGLSRIEPVFTVDARGLSIIDAAARIKAAVEKTEAAHIFVDSLSRLAQGANLNDNATATMLIDALAGLPTSVTWIGHTGQENRHRLSGSKHFKNAARLMVRVQGRISTYGVSPELKRGLRVSMLDANGAAPVPPQYWTLEYHRDFGLKSIVRSSEDEWPVLHCEARYESRGNERTCGRRTWDGVLPGIGVRCDQHMNEEDEPQ
jgi:hypothetical protein